MTTYIVFEQTPQAIANGQPVPYGATGAPVYNQYFVEADTAKEATDIVMRTTRRVGSYAVCECEMISYAPDLEVGSGSDGVLRAKRPKELVDDVETMARDTDRKIEKLERDIDRIKGLA